MKKRISAVLCAATAMGGVLAVPTGAQAADPFPKGFHAEVANEEVNLSFNTWDAPADLKVHVRKKGTTTRVATITGLSAREPECTSSCEDPIPPTTRYFSTGPLKLPDLGEYTLDVEYDGTEGDTVLHQDKAALKYQLRPVFENVKASDSVSLAQLDTVVSGDVQIHDPRDSSRKPFAGGTVTRLIGTASTPVTTDAQGHFESKVTLSGAEPLRPHAWAEGWYYVAIDLAAELNGATAKASPENPSVSHRRARITRDATKVTGAYGTRGKVGGTVDWQTPDGTYKPVPAGMKIKVGSETVSTDSTGRFAAFPQFRADTSWTVVEDSPWLYGSGPQVAVDTTAGTLLSGFRAAVDQYKTVNVKAQFERGEIPAGTTALKVDVETSADGKTGWTTRKSVNVATQPGANAAATVETTLPYPGPGYVRLRYAGTPAIHGAVTPAVKIARTMTAIPRFDAAPEPAKKGQPLTVTGTLNHADPTWKPLPDQSVQYYFRPTGTTTWKLMGDSRTTADGTFTKAFTADRTGSWYARYSADTTHFMAASPVDEVIVNP
ncbi:hypothetical protein OTB20_24945 [Streptomyces sp. H27-H1]|uniref:hypothetical protein n=1 Tax=Streptomyces sp. H27-H1 TaxID=2996461 RepID=UPI00226E21D8|nr:hypothetical protein [Streptomyces sp. H27-H1]MCY0929388.1 hypothetical protein [Streptomyces sp. H27-H1]